jgi:hypothetical protein
MSDIPECMTYVVHPDIACMMLKRNIVNARVSSPESKVEA